MYDCLLTFLGCHVTSPEMENGVDITYRHLTWNSSTCSIVIDRSVEENRMTCTIECRTEHDRNDFNFPSGLGMAVHCHAMPGDTMRWSMICLLLRFVELPGSCEYIGSTMIDYASLPLRAFSDHHPSAIRFAGIDGMRGFVTVVMQVSECTEMSIHFHRNHARNGKPINLPPIWGEQCYRWKNIISGNCKSYKTHLQTTPSSPVECKARQEPARWGRDTKERVLLFTVSGAHEQQHRWFACDLDAISIPDCSH